MDTIIFYLWRRTALTTIYGQLKQSVENGKLLFNMSNGEQVRDYMHVKDVAKAIIHVSENDSYSGAINICSGQRKIKEYSK